MPASRKSALEIFKVAGVQVEIDWSWIIIAILILWSLSAGYFPHAYPGYSTGNYWLVGAVGTVLFFASVLGHELSHAAIGNRLGEHIDRITLFIFGGMAHLSGEPRTPGDEFKIAGVGPLASVVIAAIFWGISAAITSSVATTLWSGVFHYLAFINLALAVFNLLPGFPLDGGRLLRAYLWKRWGDLRRATAAASNWGNGLAWVLMVLGALEIFGGGLIGGLWLIFIGLFLRAAAASGYQSTVIEQILGKTQVAELMIREPITLYPEITVNEAVENYFLHHGYSSFPVVRDRQVLGLLPLGRVRECPAYERAIRPVSDVMLQLAPNLKILPTATVLQAIHQMEEAGLGRLLVMDGERLLGIITRSDIARFLQIKSQLVPSEIAAENI